MAIDLRNKDAWGNAHIGIFICTCGIEPIQTGRKKKLEHLAVSSPAIREIFSCAYMCSEEGILSLTQTIRQHKLSKIIIAACSPEIHGNAFRQALVKTGLIPDNDLIIIQLHDQPEHNRIKMNADIKNNPLNNILQTLFDIYTPEFVQKSVHPATLVVGGGIAGMQASLDVAASGSQVYLVEKLPTIGGHMLQYDKTFPTLDCSACIGTPKMVSVSQHKNIELYTSSEVLKVNGRAGRFTVKIKKQATFVNSSCTGCGECSKACPVSVDSEWDYGTKTRKAIYIPFPQAVPVRYTIDKDACIDCNLCVKKCTANAIDHSMEDEQVELSVGSIILATGFDPMDPSSMDQYGYKNIPNVFNNIEFERLCNATGPTGGKILLRSSFSQQNTKTKHKKKPQHFTTPPQSAAILHCIGSRDINHHEYCSRTCCMYALKYAHLLKDKCGRDTKVYNYYIDMRCYGKGYEEFYRKVQLEGVHMIRGKVDHLAEDDNGQIIVRAEDTFSQTMTETKVDMVILCTAMEARDDTVNLRKIFGVETGADGFFAEKHNKISPVKSSIPGIFLAGTCQGPKDIPDSVAHAKAAASACIRLYCANTKTQHPMQPQEIKKKCTANCTYQQLIPPS